MRAVTEQVRRWMGEVGYLVLVGDEWRVEKHWS